MTQNDNEFIENVLMVENKNLVDGSKNGNHLTENNQNISAPVKKKKKQKIKKQTHFAARKLHEEAANSKNKRQKQNDSKLDESLDGDLNKTDSAGRINSYYPCDHPGKPCNELCKCVRDGNQNVFLFNISFGSFMKRNLIN